jgi:hypothetical protein
MLTIAIIASTCLALVSSMPATGIDFTGVDRFWTIVERGATMPAAQGCERRRGKRHQGRTPRPSVDAERTQSINEVDIG